MPKILFVNHGHGDRCGVWNYGDRYFRSLISDDSYTFIYVDVTSEEGFDSAFQEHSPDALIFNYAPIVMPWVSTSLSRYRVPKFVMQHNYEQKTLDGIHSRYHGIFNYVVVLDPTITGIPGRVFSLPRPIPEPPKSELSFSPDDEEIRIGSFGFALPHKQFPLLAAEINRCFDKAVFNLHMTEGRFAAGYTPSILESVQREITKPGILLVHTSNYLPEEGVVENLGQNHINALFYDWPPEDAGLSSSTDFMMASRRPMLLSNCAMFNHVRRGSFMYPAVTFTDILGDFRNCEDEARQLYSRSRGQVDVETKAMLRSVGI